MCPWGYGGKQENNINTLTVAPSKQNRTKTKKGASFVHNLFLLCRFLPAGTGDHIYCKFCIVASAVTLSPPVMLHISTQINTQVYF